MTFLVGICLGAAALLCALLFSTSKGQKRSCPPCPSNWLPIIGHLHLLSELPHVSLFRLSQEYGPLMLLRLGSIPTVVASSPTVAREFLKTHDLVFASRPKLMGPRYFFYNFRDVGWAEYGEYWRQMRKVCTLELFSQRRIDEFAGIRTEEMSFLLEFITDKGESGRVAVDMSQALAMTSMNVITRIAIGRRYMGTAEDSKLLRLIQEALDFNGSFYLGDHVPSLAWFDPRGTRRKVKEVHSQIDQALQEILQERRKNPSTHKDLLDILLSLEDMEEDSIKAVLLDVIAGGADTSSLTVEWALSELIRNPATLVKAQQEVDGVIGKERLVSKSDLAKLPYLESIIKETFRIHPPLPLLLPHQAMEECEIQGYRIPKEARLLVNAWSIGRDESTWGDSALEFQPERFLGKEVDLKGQDFELIPFGAGRRMCPGMSLGLHMVELLLAHMIHCFEWSIQDTMDMEEAAGLTLRRKVPLKAIAKPRLGMP